MHQLPLPCSLAVNLHLSLMNPDSLLRPLSPYCIRSWIKSCFYCFNYCLALVLFSDGTSAIPPRWTCGAGRELWSAPLCARLLASPWHDSPGGAQEGFLQEETVEQVLSTEWE